jgi:hypothetical protein
MRRRAATVNTRGSSLLTEVTTRNFSASERGLSVVGTCALSPTGTPSTLAAPETIKNLHTLHTVYLSLALTFQNSDHCLGVLYKLKTEPPVFTQRPSSVT